jgi:hypothetical protein
MTYIMLLILGFYIGFALGTRLFGKQSEETKPKKKEQPSIKWKHDSEGRPVDD